MKYSIHSLFIGACLLLTVPETSGTAHKVQVTSSSSAVSEADLQAEAHEAEEHMSSPEANKRYRILVPNHVHKLLSPATSDSGAKLPYLPETVLHDLSSLCHYVSLPVCNRNQYFVLANAPPRLSANRNSTII